MTTRQTVRHSVSVAGAIIQADRALAIRRRDNGRWEPPGGVLELPEPIPDGLIREVAEETGLYVQIDFLTGVYKNLRRGIVALVFRCHIAGGELRVTAETTDAQWMDRPTIVERMDQAYAVRLTDALDNTGGPPAIRAHDGIRLATP